MSFDIVERSLNDGTPVELYTFTRSAQVFRYTSADEDVLYQGATFTAVPLSRPSFEQSQDPGRKPISLKASSGLGFVQQYIASPPTDSISLIIRRFHTEDNTTEAVISWMGRVTNVKFESNQVEIQCEPIFTSMKRPGLRRLYQTTCPHLLYGPECKFSKPTFQLDAAVNITGGTTLTAASIGGEADGFYTGGMVEWTNAGVIDKRFILTHTGSGITINLPFEGMVNGDSVRIFPGCDHVLSTCVDKFSNEVNYGGFPFIPTKNPFSGTPIF
ncbi:MAG: hypothetical protein COA47_09925 [Robiginitomaculum sp.]|nr:MAG: hypothetical protein COA47_09925 [Robiginitomaculum sp.]